MPKKYVLIVESPTKARTLTGHLGQEYAVYSSKGHVRDLPAKELGVDVDNDFAPTWVVRNRRVIGDLKKAAAGAECVYLATDPDREGEAIAFDLAELLGNGKGNRFARVLLHELTADAVRRALRSPGKLDPHKVEAQRTRRILDRLVGYQVSPVLSVVLAGRRFEGLSAGRVQSVALRFICVREAEIQRFVPQPYWEVGLSFPTEPAFTAELTDHIGTREELDALQKALGEAEISVTSVSEEDVKRRPSLPFITSTLQQTAGAELGFSPRRTMQVAQSLYEGVEIKGKPVGLITYMRTDSTRVSDAAVSEAREYVRKQYGKEYASPRPRRFKNKRRTQDAHEAVRPTAVRLTPQEVRRYLKPEQYKLYELIWRRFVATQMADGVWRRRKVDLEAAGRTFRASTSWEVFPGFASVYPVSRLDDEELPLPEGLSEGMTLPRPEVQVEEKYTEPPGRYTESGLVRKLEREGVGRPSTYAQIVSVIQERGYVRRGNGSLRPTLLGQAVSSFLEQYFPETVEEGFTARMEEKLDKIQEGQAGRLDVLRELYSRLERRLEKVEDVLAQGEKPFQVLTDVECEKCGAPMTVRVWKGGMYLGCSNYPNCRTTRNLPPTVPFRLGDGRVELAEALAEADKAPGQECPACGNTMELRHGRYGRYMSCTSCRQTSPVYTGVTCPSCGSGELVERFARGKGPFFGCDQYPSCKFTLSGQPVEPCGTCEKGVLYQDPRHGLRCSNKHCPSRG
ncbi:MAG: type I DNA topoisomerase [Candidatus Bipolaricaulota bacterium]